MNHGMITYRSVSFPCNPASFTVSYKKQLGEVFSPYLGTVIQEMGPRACTVSGEGVLVGDQALEDFSGLKNAFEESGSALLKVSGLPQFYAYFEMLELGAKAPREVTFRFSFVEDCQKMPPAQEGTA